MRPHTWHCFVIFFTLCTSLRFYTSLNWFHLKGQNSKIKIDLTYAIDEVLCCCGDTRQPSGPWNKFCLFSILVWSWSTTSFICTSDWSDVTWKSQKPNRSPVLNYHAADMGHFWSHKILISNWHKYWFPTDTNTDLQMTQNMY